MRIVLAGLLAGLLAGCATPQVVYQPVKVAIPNEPDLPSVRGDDLLCLSDGTYTKLVRRERELKIYAMSLKGLLEAVAEKK